jgi:hypothetical protein
MIVGTEAYYPEDSIGGIEDYQLTALFKEGELLVGQEIADQLTALHAKGGETVSFLGESYGQWKLQTVGIHGYHIGCTGNLPPVRADFINPPASEYQHLFYHSSILVYKIHSISG